MTSRDEVEIIRYFNKSICLFPPEDLLDFIKKLEELNLACLILTAEAVLAELRRRK